MPAPSKKTPGYKYRTLSEAMPDVAGEYLAGSQPADLFQKYSKLVMARFGRNTLYIYLNRYGASQARRAAGLNVTNRSKGYPSAAPSQQRRMIQTAQKVKARLEEKALEHTERVIAEVDKTHAVLAKRRPTSKTLGRHLSDLDRWDQIARRTFQMDEDEEITPHSLSLTILTNLKSEDLTPIHDVTQGGRLECPILATGTAHNASEGEGAL